MVFFKRKTQEEAPKEKKSLRTPEHERVLTAEGWRRRAVKKPKAK